MEVKEGANSNILKPESLTFILVHDYENKLIMEKKKKCKI